MRPKVLLSALLTAGASVVLALWVAGTLRGPPASAPITETKPANPPAGFQARATIISLEPQPLKASGPLRNGDALADIGSRSVDGILADLEKPGREVHQAALQRARELGDRSIIPRLREIAQQVGDGQESADILDTIDFLNLPDLAENMAEAQAARAAVGQPDPPQSLTNRWTGRPFVRQQ
jgi:hypothetical protein